MLCLLSLRLAQSCAIVFVFFTLDVLASSTPLGHNHFRLVPDFTQLLQVGAAVIPAVRDLGAVGAPNELDFPVFA